MQDGMFYAADVLVYRQPLINLLRNERLIIILW